MSKTYQEVKAEKDAILKTLTRLEGEFNRIKIEKKAINERFNNLKAEIRGLSEELNEKYIEMDTIETQNLINQGL